jgi:redox-sensitive bicupin YhaK (pirin superfamily)
MIVIRDRNSRGATQLGWLDSRHSFSFGDYRDPAHMGFRTLRVINEDRVIPGAGFPTHGHRDMEIISIVLSGALEHKDSLGNGSVIRPGEIQRMSAGTGITHSEFNHSDEEPLHFLQIWILPERSGLSPSYEQRRWPSGARDDGLMLIGDRHATDGAVSIHQDVRLYLARLEAGQSLTHKMSPGRHAWLQVAGGIVTLVGDELRAGDGVAISDEPLPIELHTETGANVLLFDLA